MIVNALGQSNFIEVIQVTPIFDITCSNDGTGGESCFAYSDFKLERDLVRPSSVSMIRGIAGVKNISPLNDYKVFLRDFNSGALTETSMGSMTKTKDSLVFVHKDILVSHDPFGPGCSGQLHVIDRIASRIKNSYGILPTRFVWP